MRPSRVRRNANNAEPAEYLTREEGRALRLAEDKQAIIDRELTELYTKNKKINEDIVVEAARDPSSPLHSHFEWDDSVAANNWRKRQALDLILASKMVVILHQAQNTQPRVLHAEQPEVRRLVNAFRGKGFVLRTDALANDDMRVAIVEKHKAKLRGWCRETVDIKELQPLRESILEKLKE